MPTPPHGSFMTPLELSVTSDEIRKSFLGLLRSRRGIGSCRARPLIPHNDPTLLLRQRRAWCRSRTTSPGQKPAPWPRATSVTEVSAGVRQAQRPRQRGPHAAPPHVLRDARELQLRDYFKREAIPWAWELLTEVWGIEADRLWVTIFTRATTRRSRCGTTGSGCPRSRIQRLGAKDNFWSMGDDRPVRSV